MEGQMKRKPIAVLISDIHFNVNSKTIASEGLSKARDYAFDNDLTLIIPGDLNDTKAIIRAECANEIIKILSYKLKKPRRVVVLVGNHDLINEKGKEHSLNFLAPLCEVIETPVYDSTLGVWLIPYMTDVEELKVFLKKNVLQNDTLIMHQGLKGAFMGEYVIDKTSIEPEYFDGLRVISGHYHRAQDIKCGKNGLWSYIGSPYTITAAEAQDGPKGFRILYSDGSLELIPTNLRKHVTVDRTIETVTNPIPNLNPGDILWLRVEGPATELQKLSKKIVGLHHLGHQNFKFDKIYSKIETIGKKVEKLTNEEVFDRIIEDSDESSTQKKLLKNLWREIVAA
jgi:DNA repair exonuclease SbcCD nuclease subunit